MTEGGSSTTLEVIVLAAGAGARFGGAKLTAPWRGGLLIHGALAAAFDAPARAVAVVTGADPRVGPVAQAWASRQGETARLRMVHAIDYVEGMAATLCAGLAALPADTSGVFVFLGDMPDIPAAILQPLVNALASGAKAAAPAFNGKRGHPVLFSRGLFDALTALRGDTGAREILHSLGDTLALVQTSDPGVLFDVDTAATPPQRRSRPW